MSVEASPLIAGDGIDLVARRDGHRSITVQLDITEALRLAAEIIKATEVSHADAERRTRQRRAA